MNNVTNCNPNFTFNDTVTLGICYPPVSEESREVANLSKRKNPHTHVYGVKEFVYLSVRTEWAEIFFRTSMAKRHVPKFFIW